MSGENWEEGQAMLEGIRLCMDMNQDILRDRSLEVVVLDKNDPTILIKAESVLNAKDKNILYISHYARSGKNVSERIYEAKNIPVITASNKSNVIHFDVNWVFSIMPSSEYLSKFAVNYIKQVLKADKIIMIFRKFHAYSSNFYKDLCTEAINKGISIEDVSYYDELDRETLVRISNSLSSKEVIFCATHAVECVKIVSALNYPDSGLTIIGPDSFSEKAFIKKLSGYPAEQKFPGYHSNGVYAITPYFPKIAGKAYKSFRKSFQKKYGREPVPMAASYYEAALVALEAICRTDSNYRDIADYRIKIKKTLDQFVNSDIFIDGIFGDINFDKQGCMNRPPGIGVYQNQELLPAYSQYDRNSSISPHDNLEKLQNKEVMKVGDKLLEKRQVIYAGMNNISINKLGFQNEEYSIECDIWFRFRVKFDPRDIRFMNAVTPIKLEQPIFNEKHGDISIMAYRIKGLFKKQFDRKLLTLKFYNNKMPENSLVFASDIMKKQNLRERCMTKSALKKNTGWQIKNLSFQIDSINISYRPYSVFTAQIEIKRTGSEFAVKFFFPILVVIAISYITWYLPPDRWKISLFLSFMVIFVTALIHVKIFRTFSKEFMPLEYALVIVIYVFGTVTSLASLAKYRMYCRHEYKRIKDFNFAGKIIHPSLVLCVGLWLTWIYFQ